MRLSEAARRGDMFVTSQEAQEARRKFLEKGKA